jgi:two-component system OmpR family response regulator
MRILVVEDEPTLQTQLRDAIAAAGHTVETAADGSTARYLGQEETLMRWCWTWACPWWTD